VEEAMIDLKLSDAEARNLESALARRVDEMMSELVHTTDRVAHEELKASYEKLDALHQRVTELLASPKELAG
jgi:hypothetical protein